MNRVKKVLKYILDSDYRFMVNAYKGLYNNWPDEKYLKKMCEKSTERGKECHCLKA